MKTLSELKPHYRTGADDLASEFFGPCLQVAKLYRRAAGYFSSMALVTWADALPRLMKDNDLKVRLIACPELSAHDLAVFKELTGEEKRIEYRRMLVERMLEEVIALTERPEDISVRARLLAWLIANERLEVRFAFATHLERSGIFHEKIGVFDFPTGEQVAFTGSANETLGGHRLNYESIDVYRSWVAEDEDRVQTKAEQFEEAWKNQAAGLDVEEPTAETVSRLKARAPKVMPRGSAPPKRTRDPSARWRHQDEAVEAFLERRAGVLEMATGTGKTRTTLKIFDHLIETGTLRAVIIAMDGTDLLDQWCSELEQWVHSSRSRWRVYRHFERHKELGDFSLDPYAAILVISRSQLRRAFVRVPAVERKTMMIVHDEVHGLGVPSLVGSLSGQHKTFGWRLGLSATPERAYDQAGNIFILEEIGPTAYQFPLESAISRGVLSEFDYVPLPYELTENDRRRIRDVYAKRAARKQEGNPMADEEVWTEISRVYKTAEMKPEVFSDYLKEHPEILKHCIVFVETKEYGNALLEELHEYTTRYRTYYAEDDRDHLVEFARNQIDCLITCHRISQGIDIHSLRTVVLFASARSKLETIQRIGRCLRIDPEAPNKRALVVDFVRPDTSSNSDDQVPNADTERCRWLSTLSKTRRAAND